MSDSDTSDSSDSVKIQRDDLINPYWIDDRDLKNGSIEFLKVV